MLFNAKLFKTTLLFLVLAELLSLTSFTFSWLETVGFFAVLLITLLLSLKKLEWGLYVVLAELFIGSFGQLFSYEIVGFPLSIRIALFVVVMAVWLAQLARKNKEQPVLAFFKTSIGKWYVALGAVLIWGLVFGLIRNDFGNVFFDFNNWLYFLYILPLYEVFVLQSPEQRKNILTILYASIVVVGFKTLMLLWFFSHQIPGTIEMFYQWVRDYRLGEITFYAQNFYRIFLQSQIWLMIGFFIVLGLHIGQHMPIIAKQPLKKWGFSYFHLTLLLSSITLIISFSRSLWLGWFAGLTAFFVLLMFRFKWPILKITKWIVGFIAIIVIEAIIIIGITNLPPVKDAGDFGSLVSDRVLVVEAAGSSRINLLGPLWKEITISPIIGSGFGSVVTYDSVDPRILNQTAGASGEYTTYAFEWSYLDMWLKVGLVGLVVYLGLLFQLFRHAWSHMREHDVLAFGLFLALFSLLAVNITTPYLNHPLGIGFVLIMTLFLIDRTPPLLQKPVI